MSGRTDTERLDWLEHTGGMWDVGQNNDGTWYIEDDGESWDGRTLREALDKLALMTATPEAERPNEMRDIGDGGISEPLP